jgi:UrcA family protein
MTNFNSRTQRLTRAGLCAALALCTCLIGHDAAAERRQVAVSYADLDLSKPAGAQTLYKRIKGAASRVCRPTGLYVMASRSHRKCIETAVADAVAQVDRPSLTALHREQTARTARG